MISQWLADQYTRGFDAWQDTGKVPLRSKIAWYLIYKTPLGRI